MAKHPLINGRASGYWGRDIRCRIDSELISDKVLSLNLDKIMAMGIPYALWREASSVEDGLTQCSCYKDTSKQADIPCLSCYGTGAIPGFFKFGTKTYWAASIDAGWTLASMVLDKNNRPFRFQLDPAATTGTATSPNLAISVATKLGVWDAKFEGFTRDGGAASTIAVEASIDNGSNWFPLANIEAQGPTIQLRFRVTMTRTAITVKSPMFEIVRARFPTITDVRGELDEPVIRVIPTWLTESELRQTHGTKLEATGNRFWTMPLAFFDTTISLNTRGARIADDTFVEERHLLESGYRYAVTEFSYSDTFGKFTRQEFALRKYSGEPGSLTGEANYRVW